MGSDRLVFVSPPSSQLDIRSKLQSLHSGLDKCYSLLERAIALEKMELDRDQMSEYKNGRRRLKEELLNLLKSTEELLKAAGGKPVRNQDDLEVGVDVSRDVLGSKPKQSHSCLLTGSRIIPTTCST